VVALGHRAGARPRILKPWPGAEWERSVFEPDAEVIERACASETELVDAVTEADILLADIGTPVTARVLAAGRRLRAVMCYASGVDHVDVPAATAHGVFVITTRGYATVAVAEHTLALLLAVARKLVPAHRDAARVSWREWPPLRGLEVAGKTLGVIGLGPIGRAVAARALALGMRVLTHSRSGSVTDAPAVDLGSLLHDADVVSLHCALTPERFHLIGERELRSMRPTAILLNTARGALVDETALVRALAEGWIAGAGLDVLETEPPPPDHPLLRLESVVVTPHNAYNSREADERFRSIIRTQVRRVLAGDPPDIFVNPEVLEHGREAPGAARSTTRRGGDA
jgi:phosphoglycerate dehydrogenase-like enzyme